MSDVRPEMAKGEHKNYLGEAVLSALSFYFGLIIGGYFTAIYFLLDARRTHAAGRPTKNVGCLWAVLVFHTLLIIVVLGLYLSARLSG